MPDLRRHLLAGYETVDLLARNYLGRESLFWQFLDANDGRVPDSFVTGELIDVPSLDAATLVRRTGMTETTLFASVKVEGQELVDYVVRIQLEENDTRADVVRITFADGNLVMCDVLHEGQKVEVDMGRPTSMRSSSAASRRRSTRRSRASGRPSWSSWRRTA